jgi:CrcB protein
VSETLLAFVTHPAVLVGLGSAAGGILRYYVGKSVDTYLASTGFPWGTFVINVSGSFILGVLGLLLADRVPHEYRWIYLLFGTGFCGGFTTFSTFEWETFKLLRDGSIWLALGNVVGSVVAGFLGVLLAVLAVFTVMGRPQS